MTGRLAVRAVRVIWAFAADVKHGRNDMMTRSKGFTLVDLLAVIVCLAILTMLIVPGMPRASERANQAACRANLRGIGTAVAMFKGEDKNSRFPLLWTTGRPEAHIAWTDSAMNIEKLKEELIGKESAMQNVWAIIDKGLVTEDAFGCPADKDYITREFEDRADRNAHRVGWRTAHEFSYGLHFPYRSKSTGDGPADPTKVDNPAHLGPHMKGSFVIMTDRNPSYISERATGLGPDKPPSNHEDSMAWLMLCGAVNWKDGAEDSVINGDDIYTIRKENNANPATPADLDDQYIVRHPWIPIEIDPLPD